MDKQPLRNAATTVAKMIEQTLASSGVQCSIIWKNSEAQRLGFKLPGPHTVGFLLRFFYSNGDEFSQLIPLAKDVIKRPSNWPGCLTTVTKYWLAALQNEQERLRPGSSQPSQAAWPMIACVACGERLLRDLAIFAQITHCPNCNTAYTVTQIKRSAP